ncbi:hypothetical protein C0J52_07879 [Blattella germanica]|nr:hypothetical protein C0J52_07879 [Blattella germanica]
MFSIKALPLLLSAACLATNLIVVTGDCLNVKGQTDADFTKVLGKWYEGFLSQCKLDRATKWEFDLGATSVEGSSIPTGSNEEVKFNASISVNPSTAEFTAGFPDSVSGLPLGWLSTTYTLVQTDVDCYFISAACPSDSCSPLVFIWFREEHPSKDCIDRATAALSKARLESLGNVVKDPAFIKEA